MTHRERIEAALFNLKMAAYGDAMAMKAERWCDEIRAALAEMQREFSESMTEYVETNSELGSRLAALAPLVEAAIAYHVGYPATGDTALLERLLGAAVDVAEDARLAAAREIEG